MNKEFIKQLTVIVEANLANETFGPDELVREAGMSHSNLNRKLKSISNQNSSQFIREIRLKKAKELLLNKDLTVAEISYRVGFGSPTYFNKCFREYFGFAPGQIRNVAPEIEPIEKPVEQPVVPQMKTPKRKKILIGLVIGLMVLIPTTYFLIYNVAGSKAANEQEKSIAILPFKYLGGESDKQYLADGTMDDILVHLSKIKDLRVVSRTSVEQYRKTDKTSKTIGRELDVKYLLEGSFEMTGTQVRLILQLINTSNDSHVWSDIFDRDWKDIFSIQSEVAEVVAKRLQAVITPEEQQLIRKTPTSNLTAYDYYIKGKNELEKNEFSSKGDAIALKNAQLLFQKALELDSTFALAYTGLAAINYKKYYWKTYLSGNFMDSVLILANKALAYDTQCAEAFYFRGLVFSETSKPEEALKEIDQAIQLNPNDWEAYALRSSIFEVFQEHVGAISNLHEAVLRNRGIGLPHILAEFSYKLSNFGFPELGKKYSQQVLELDGDTARHLDRCAWAEYTDGNLETAYQLARSSFRRDSISDRPLALYCAMTGRNEEGYLLLERRFERFKKSGKIDDPFAPLDIAYCLWQTGRTKEAEFYFNKKINYDLESIKHGRWPAIQRYPQFDLAGNYVLLGNKEKAYTYLDDVIKDRAFPTWWVILYKFDPRFNSIRQEPRFQKMLKEVETKCQAERKLVGKWLAKQGIL
jgi:TolB-like protein/AraC-like DNA-binding protein/tetratricopeptide (TPR) repeat protein